jgi:hypothetical protein
VVGQRFRDLLDLAGKISTKGNETAARRKCAEESPTVAFKPHPLLTAGRTALASLRSTHVHGHGWRTRQIRDWQEKPCK